MANNVIANTAITKLQVPLDSIQDGLPIHQWRVNITKAVQNVASNSQGTSIAQEAYAQANTALAEAQSAESLASEALTVAEEAYAQANLTTQAPGVSGDIIINQNGTYGACGNLFYNISNSVLTVNGYIQIGNGSNTIPAVFFIQNPNTGFYLSPSPFNPGISVTVGNYTRAGNVGQAVVNIIATTAYAGMNLDQFIIKNGAISSLQGLNLNVSQNIECGNIAVTQNANVGNLAVTQNINCSNLNVTTNASMANVNCVNLNVTSANVSVLNLISSVNGTATVNLSSNAALLNLTAANINVSFGVNLANMLESANVSNIVVAQLANGMYSVDTRLTVTGGGGGTIFEAGNLVLGMSNANINFNNTQSINLLAVANGTTQVNVNATINATLNLTSLNVTSNIATGNLAVTQNTTTGNLIVLQNSNTGNINVTGNIYLSKSLNVSTVNCSGNIITGNLVIQQNTSTGNLTVTQNTTTGNLIVVGNISVNGISSVQLWTTLTLNASYTNVSSYNPPGYWVDPWSIVHLRGLIKPSANLALSSTLGINIANGLPKPANTSLWLVAAANDTILGTNVSTALQAFIYPNGALQLGSDILPIAGNLVFFSLDGFLYSNVG